MSHTQIVTASSVGNGLITYQSIDGGKWERVDGERALAFSFHKDTIRKIMGKVLTIIDASIGEPQQNKAMKDLVRQVIQDELDFSSEMAFDQEKLQAILPEDIDDLETVSLETALGVREN